MSEFDAENMVKFLDEIFNDTYVEAEQDGDEVVVSCAELGVGKCRKTIYDEFDGKRDGIISGWIDNAIGANIVAGEDFVVHANEEDNEIVLSGPNP